jgi:hypothetical protein
MIKSKLIWIAGTHSMNGNMKNEHIILMTNLKGGENSVDLGIDEKITLKCVEINML